MREHPGREATHGFRTLYRGLPVKPPKPPEPPRELIELKKAMKPHLPEEYHEMVDKATPSIKFDELPVISAITRILNKHGNALNYLRSESKIYPTFLDRVKSLGIKEDFNEPGQKFEFKITELPKTTLDSDEYYAFYDLLRSGIFDSSMTKSLTAIKKDLLKEKNPDPRDYLHLSIREAAGGAGDLFDAIESALMNKDHEKAANLAIEFYRDRVWSDAIDKDPNAQHIKEKVLPLIEKKIKPLQDLLETAKKPVPEENPIRDFELELGDKGAMDLLKGTIGMDCSSFTGGFAFANATCKHILDPAFLNFKIYQKEEGKRNWVGNVYSLVTEIEGKSALVIDAIQTSPKHWIISNPQEVVKNVTGALKQYAKQNGFDKVYVSHFVSNRPDLKQPIQKSNKPVIKRVAKLGGYDHLDELNLTTTGMGGREYIETFATGATNIETRGKNVDQEVRLFEL